MDKVSFKKKLDNFWYYYKIHTFVAIFIIVVIAFTVSTSGGSKYDLNLTIVAEQGFSSEKAQTQVEKKLSANAETLFIGQNVDKSSQTSYVQKLFAMTAAGEVDVIIGDKDYLNNYAKQGSLLDLDSYIKSGKLPKDLNVEKVKTESNKECTSSIDLENSKVLQDAGLDITNKVIGIGVKTKHKDAAIKCINEILKK